MSKGILIFAHNNPQIDYSKLAYIAAIYAKKNLKVPISLVTDTNTKKWAENHNNFLEIYDRIVLTDDIKTNVYQSRRYYDGSLNYKKADFRNNYRAWSYQISPYDETLVIDVDLLITNNKLNNIWGSNGEFMINKKSFDLARDRKILEFERISDHSIDFFWATAFYFKKTEWNKIFFNLCQHIIENYQYYRFVYRINYPLMRNDFVFSIALHIMGGFSNRIDPPSLPCEIYYTLDRDELIKVDENSFTFLIEKKNYIGEYTLARTKNQNVHIMNKFSINRNFDNLIGAINV